MADIIYMFLVIEIWYLEYILIANYYWLTIQQLLSSI